MIAKLEREPKTNYQNKDPTQNHPAHKRSNNNELEFREADLSPGKTEVKANVLNLYPRRRDILEKLINHKTLIPFHQPLSSPWV